MSILSVVVLTYKPSYISLLRTIKSILFQKEIEYELIIADDCTPFDNNTIDRVEEYINKFGFDNYRIIKNVKNTGTVKNLLNALSYTKGDYIKVMGQGDFLYDETTLFDMYNSIKEKKSSLLFGNYTCFENTEDSIKIVKREELPYNINAYVRCDRDSIKKSLVLLCDVILGASVMYKKDVLKNTLEKCKDDVVYGEDYLIRVMGINDEKIDYLNRNVILYEWGSGVSTSGNSEFRKRLDIDWNNVGKILCESSKDLSYSDDLRDVVEYHYVPEEKKKKALSFYLKHIDIGLFKFKKIFFKRTSPLIIDEEFVNKCIK